MAMLQISSAGTLHTLHTSHTSHRAPSRVLTIAWWASVRLVVAALCVGFLLGFAQLTVHSLVAYYANIAPFAGTG